jgi:hypothetical protein
MRELRPVAFLLLLCPLGAAGCAPHHHRHHGEGRLTMDDLPTEVRDHFNRDHPDVEVQGIQKMTQDGVTHYEVDFADHGEPHEAIYDREGDEIKPDAKLP